MNVYSASLKGLRNANEDNHDIIQNINGNNPNMAHIDYYAVYDGHSNKMVSNYLKANLSKFFLDPRVKYPLSKQYVNNVFDLVQNNLKNQSYAQHGGSTTVIVIKYRYQNSDYINVINVGDSRAVLCRNDLAIPLNHLHKPTTPFEHNRIVQLGGNIVFDGYDHRIMDLSVSRAMGDIDATPYVTHKPDLFRYKLDSNDKFIIVSCDGLEESLKLQDMVDFVIFNSYESDLKTRKKNDVNVAKKLSEYAINKGSHDNCSCVIAFLK